MCQAIRGHAMESGVWGTDTEFTTPLSMQSTEMLPRAIACGFHPLWNLALCLLSVINVLMGSKKRNASLAP